MSKCLYSNPQTKGESVVYRLSVPPPIPPTTTFPPTLSWHMLLAIRWPAVHPECKCIQRTAAESHIRGSTQNPRQGLMTYRVLCWVSASHHHHPVCYSTTEQCCRHVALCRL